MHARLDLDLRAMPGELIAQDKEGNVWYFGEDVDNYEEGKLVNHDGSWKAGVDGAKPGYWIKANPMKGETYRQEYYKGEAEDMVQVVATNVKVKVPYGTFTGCVKTYDYTPLDPESRENKYYCPGVAALVLEVDLTTDEKLELTNINKNVKEDSDEDDD